MGASHHPQPAVSADRGGGKKRQADSTSELETLIRQAGTAARMLKLIANQRRLLILCFLAARGEMKVGDLVKAVRLGQSALSQHLARLRADGLVTYRRESQTLYYRIADVQTMRLLDALKSVYCGDLK